MSLQLLRCVRDENFGDKSSLQRVSRYQILLHEVHGRQCGSAPKRTRFQQLLTISSEEHSVICQNYIDVPPRPSQDHRFHLMLPFQRHPALSFGFVWRKNMEEVKNEIAPGLASQNFHSLSLFQEDDEGDREVAAYHVLCSSFSNEVLGDLVAGRATQQITGSFCIHVYVADDDGEGIDDALPSDLHKALHRVAVFERKFGPVKIVLDPSIDALYAGGAA